MALAMLVTPVNITSVKADQIYNIEKSSQSQITENKIEKLINILTKVIWGTLLRIVKFYEGVK